MSKRPGATLVEVLIAIFVMGIGLLALLALFPLGVLQMAQAIQDDRAMHSAVNATSRAVAQNLHRDGLAANGTVAPGTLAAAFTNPAPGDPTVLPADDNGPSWPVLVDAVGKSSAPAPYDQWVGGVQYGLARRTATYANTPAAVLNWFTLLDDIRFAVNATPNPVTAAPLTFDREGNFSWAYLMRRPRNANTAAVNMDVVVYSRRSLNLTQALTMPEFAYSGTYDATRPNVLTLTWNAGQNPPAVRAGGWVLDASPQPVQSGGQTVYAPSHAQFYRVVGVNEVANNPYAVELEMQDNVLGFPLLNGSSVGTFIVLEGVVEVFPRGTQWRP